MSPRPAFRAALLLGVLGAWPAAAHVPRPTDWVLQAAQSMPILKSPPGLFVKLPHAPRILLWDEVRPFTAPERAKFKPLPSDGGGTMSGDLVAQGRVP